MTILANIVWRVWRLWEVLMNPYSHPVFHRVIRLNFEQDFSVQIRALKLLIRILIVMAVIYAAWYDVRTLLFIIVLPIFMILAMFIIPVMMPVAVISYCTYLSMRIGQIISRERMLNTYELIRTVPEGGLFVNWRIASGVMFSGEVFEWLHMITTVLIKAAVILLLVLLGFVLFFSRSTPDFLLYVRTLIEAGTVVGIFFTGYIQAVILAILLGMHTPLFDIDEREVIAGTIVIYLAVQVTIYAIVFVPIYFLHPVVSGQSIWLDLVLPPFYWLITYVWQGAIIEGLWHWLVYRLNVIDDIIAERV